MANFAFNPLCTNGFIFLVIYNTLEMVHCIYPGVTGRASMFTHVNGHVKGSVSGLCDKR